MVVGQVARDLVLQVDGVPGAGSSAPVRRRLEMLGGKGANQAVGLSQLGIAPVTVVGVVGVDDVGSWVLDQARADGIDVQHVVRRGATALLVDLVDGEGRRLIEHVPDAALLTADDVRRAAPVFAAADTVCLQLQQPAEALLAAAELAHEQGARIVLDGGPPPEARDRLLDLADVVRADAVEAAAWVGHDVPDRADAEKVAATLVDAGPSVVAIEVPDEGDLVAWHDRSELYPHPDTPVVDPTGAGDAFVGGLVTGLRRGDGPSAAGHLAARAAASTVARLCGRPDLRDLR